MRVDCIRCVPPEASNLQATLLVIHYVREHPQWLNQQLSDLAVAALRQGWPCLGSNDREVGAPMQAVPR